MRASSPHLWPPVDDHVVCWLVPVYTHVVFSDCEHPGGQAQSRQQCVCDIKVDISDDNRWETGAESLLSPSPSPVPSFGAAFCPQTPCGATGSPVQLSALVQICTYDIQLLFDLMSSAFPAKRRKLLGWLERLVVLWCPAVVDLGTWFCTHMTLRASRCPLSPNVSLAQPQSYGGHPLHLSDRSDIRWTHAWDTTLRGFGTQCPL